MISTSFSVSESRTHPMHLLGAGYLLAILMLGGGGTPAPLSELACELLAAVALLGWLILRQPAAAPVDRRIWWVMALIAGIPVAQLIPLPPAIWQALPGRATMRSALALVDQQDTWRPFTVAPQRTLDAVLSLLPPFVALLFAASMNAAGRLLLLRVIAGFGLLSVAVGAAQIAGGADGPLQFYDGNLTGELRGFQANRNAQADVLLISLLALTAGFHGWAGKSRAALGALVVIGLVLLLGVLLTSSRTGIALVPVALGWCFYLLRRTRVISRVRIAAWQWGVLGAGVALAVFAVWQTKAIGRVLARFDFLGEYRPDIWRDTLFAIGQYWPLGSGMGTFTRVFLPAERLEAIGQSIPNRAHNEVLELLLEGGIPLALCWAVVAVLVAVGLWRGLRIPQAMPTGQIAFAAGTLAVTISHSLVDYPFRSMALVSLIAVAAALVLAPQPPQQADRTPRADTL